MSSFKSFEEIIAWQKARELCIIVYKITSNDSFKKDFMLVDQARRSAVSVMANIAEGYERRGDKEFIRFLNISKGSLGELKSHMFVALDLGYLNNDTVNEVFNMITEVGKLISGIINYLKKELI